MIHLCIFLNKLLLKKIFLLVWTFLFIINYYDDWILGNPTSFAQISRDRRINQESRPDHVALTAIENTTPIKDTQTSSVSQPIPVPTQVQNYEKMQESRERAKRALAGSPSGSPSDGKILKDLYINLLFVY